MAYIYLQMNKFLNLSFLVSLFEALSRICMALLLHLALLLSSSPPPPPSLPRILEDSFPRVAQVPSATSNSALEELILPSLLSLGGDLRSQRERERPRDLAFLGQGAPRR